MPLIIFPVKLLQFSVFGFRHRVSNPIKILPQCPHYYLKNLHITGFSGTTAQLEFLVHAAENAQVLEILKIKGADMIGRDLDHDGKLRFFSQFKELERKYLHGIISPNVKLCIT
jgi:hypothetical protein